MQQPIIKQRLNSTQPYTSNMVINKTQQVIVPIRQESDDEISKRIKERFEIMEDLVDMSISGRSRSLIISGPAGLGKSYTVEQKLNKLPDEQYTISKGFIRPTGLYRLFFEHCSKNNVIAFDDSDSLFFDENSINLLKNACDTTDRRILSWRAETNMKDNSGDVLPTSFEYEGSAIFITNKDFDDMIESKDKMAPHYEALISRSYYISLTMKTRRDYFIRIRDVITDEGMLSDIITANQIDVVLKYIEENLNNLREVSLRIALKIAGIMNDHPNKWRRMSDVTCCR